LRHGLFVSYSVCRTTDFYSSLFLMLFLSNADISAAFYYFFFVPLESTFVSAFSEFPDLFKNGHANRSLLILFCNRRIVIYLFQVWFVGPRFYSHETSFSKPRVGSPKPGILFLGSSNHGILSTPSLPFFPLNINGAFPQSYLTFFI